MFLQLDRTERLSLLFLLTCGGFMASHLAMLDPYFMVDNFYRLQPVFNMMANKGYASTDSWHYIEPGTAFAIYFITFLIGDIEYAAILLNILSFLLLIPTMFLIGRCLVDARLGLLAATLITFSPKTIWYAHSPMHPPLFTLLLSLAFLTHCRILTMGPSWMRCMGHGILLGLMWLVRAEGFLPAMLSLALLFFYVFVRNHSPVSCVMPVKLSTSLKMVSAAGLFYLITASPWLIMVKYHTDEWRFIGRNGDGAYLSSTIKDNWIVPDTNEKLNNKKYYESPFIYFIAHGREMLMRLRVNAEHVFYKNIVHAVRNALAPFFFLLFLSLFFTTAPFVPLASWTHREFFIFLSILCFVSPVPVVATLYRLQIYYQSYIPFWILAISIGIWRLMRIIALNPRLVGYMAASLFFAHLILPLPGVSHQPDLPNLWWANSANFPARERLAGMWLAENCRTDTIRVLSSLNGRELRLLSFYSKRKSLNEGNRNDAMSLSRVDLTEQTIDNLMAVNNMDTLILDDKMAMGFSMVKPLWDNPATASSYNLELLHQDPANRFQVYKPLKTAKESICRKS